MIPAGKIVTSVLLYLDVRVQSSLLIYLVISTFFWLEVDSYHRLIRNLFHDVAAGVISHYLELS